MYYSASQCVTIKCVKSRHHMPRLLQMLQRDTATYSDEICKGTSYSLNQIENDESTVVCVGKEVRNDNQEFW